MFIYIIVLIWTDQVVIDGCIGFRSRGQNHCPHLLISDRQVVVGWIPFFFLISTPHKKYWNSGICSHIKLLDSTYDSEIRTSGSRLWERWLSVVDLLFWISGGLTTRFSFLGGLFKVRLLRLQYEKQRSSEDSWIFINSSWILYQRFLLIIPSLSCHK